MLRRSLVVEIHRLLLAGQMSHRRIASQLGVSRGTVHNIATGKRGLFGIDRDAATELELNEVTHLGRCPNCGCRVYLPCVACRAEDYWMRQQAGREAGGQQIAATG